MYQRRYFEYNIHNREDILNTVYIYKNGLLIREESMLFKEIYV